MVDRDIEKALDLRGMEIDKERAIGAGGDEQVGDQFRVIATRGRSFRSWRAYP